MRKIDEAVYPGNLGFMEFVKFQRVADDAQKTLMKQLIAQGDGDKVIELLSTVTGVKLQPFQRNEGVERQRVFKF